MAAVFSTCYKENNITSTETMLRVRVHLTFPVFINKIFNKRIIINNVNKYIAQC